MKHQDRIYGSADYVIIGSGSAGSTLAYRLSENPRNSVIVLEFGGVDWGPFIQMPAALSYPMNMKQYDWGFKTEPEPYLKGRQLATPRGKVRGGSSSINGMVYVRGHAKDYDFWHQSGAKNWDFQHVLPYFKKMENWHGQIDAEAKDVNWRGQNGPLHITRGSRSNPLYHTFIQAGHEAGFLTTTDYNGHCQEGFGPMEQTVWKGRRWSTANAYLKPALKRSNCRLITCFVRKIIFDQGKAVGVEIEQGGEIKIIRANAEVILSASSINSPKILLLSGIGAGVDLKSHGIGIVKDLAGVGKNLQDHLEIYMQYACLQPITLYSHFNLMGKAKVGLQWLLTKQGLGATNHFEAAAFIRSKAGVEYPDIQYHFLPLAVRYDGKSAVKGHSFQVHVGPMRSPSRGEITLRDNDPKTPPKILFNYMSHEQDWADFRHCIRITREIFSQNAMYPFKGQAIQPHENLTSDDQLNEFLQEHVESAYHPSCSVKMGDPKDAMAVVDSECKVIGIKGLRVVDSSIFPRITNGNLNAPTIMVAEKAADHILYGKTLPALPYQPYINPNWKNSDR